MPVICMQLSYVSLIVLVWISCYYRADTRQILWAGAWQVSDYTGSVCCPFLPLVKVQQEKQLQVARM